MADSINSLTIREAEQKIREIIKLVGKRLGVQAISYIDDFKQYLGKEYLLEIEKIGVNLHFIELKYI